MRNSDMPAMPTSIDMAYYAQEDVGIVGSGFTKREEIASRTMAGILANAGAAITFNNNADLLVDVAIEYTDILLKKLEESK